MTSALWEGGRRVELVTAGAHHLRGTGACKHGSMVPVREYLDGESVFLANYTERLLDLARSNDSELPAEDAVAAPA